jgi:Spy/CpxP family protein refolding chaperone
MNRLWFLVLALSLGLNAGLLYVDYSRRAGEERRPRRAFLGERGRRPLPPEVGKAMVERHLERMSAELSLTSEQRQAIAAIWEESLPAIRETRARLHDLRSQLRDRFAAAEIDSMAFRALARQAAAVQADLDSLTAGTMLAEASHLRPEQRQRYSEIMPWVSPDRMLGPRSGRPGGKGRR